MTTPNADGLVNRYLNDKEEGSFREEVDTLQSITLNSRQISDAHMIAMGACSPLQGFMGHEDYTSVVRDMRLSDGSPWPLPITFAINSLQAGDLKEGNKVALTNKLGDLVGFLLLEGKFRRDKEEEATQVYRTTDGAHPGVANLLADGDVVLGGKVSMLQGNPELDEGISEYYMTPSNTRAVIAERGWRTVVGFQTLNPVHRAHEYIQKCALESVDGLLLHPMVGETNNDDMPTSVRMHCYKVLLEGYYPKDRVVLSVLPAFMRYAGPREAIFHALVRKNYGCTHFIVGRDHAGVGNYYGPYDAQHIFEEFDPGALGITPLFFQNSFYCRSCNGMATEKTCPHSSENRVNLRGTEVKAMLAKGEMPPEEITRHEVAQILMEYSVPR